MRTLTPLGAKGSVTWSKARPKTGKKPENTYKSFPRLFKGTIMGYSSNKIGIYPTESILDK